MRMSVYFHPLVLLLTLGLREARGSEVYRFGVIPHDRPEVMAKLWEPLLEEVERRSGVKLQYHTDATAIEHDVRMKAGEYDFIFANPAAFVLNEDSYRALVRDNVLLKGILAVSKNSHYVKLVQLKGTRVCFPAPNTFAPTILNRIALREAGVDPDKDISVQYTGTQEKSFKIVATGNAEAAGGALRAFKLLDPRYRDQLRVLFITKPVISNPVAAHVRVSKKVREKVARAFLSLSGDEKGRAILRRAGFNAFIPAKNSDWDDTKRIVRSQ